MDLEEIATVPLVENLYHIILFMAMFSTASSFIEGMFEKIGAEKPQSPFQNVL